MVFQPRYRRIAWAAAVMIPLLAVFRAAVALSGDSDTSVARIGGAVAVTVACSCVLALIARVSLTVDSAHVVVQNMFRRRIFPRSEVRRLGASRAGGWAFLESTSGQRTIVLALSDGSPWTLARRLQQLNEDLQFGD
jgi:hypothetical protein